MRTIKSPKAFGCFRGRGIESNYATSSAKCGGRLTTGCRPVLKRLNILLTASTLSTSCRNFILSDVGKSGPGTNTDRRQAHHTVLSRDYLRDLGYAQKIARPWDKPPFLA